MWTRYEGLTGFHTIQQVEPARSRFNRRCKGLGKCGAPDAFRPTIQTHRTAVIQGLKSFQHCAVVDEDHRENEAQLEEHVVRGGQVTRTEKESRPSGVWMVFWKRGFCWAVERLQRSYKAGGLSVGCSLGLARSIHAVPANWA